MIWPILFFLLLLVLVVFLSPNRKYLFKVLAINILIIATYNTVLWQYISTKFNSGGASLGPGLMLLFITMVHLVIMAIYIIWNYKKM